MLRKEKKEKNNVELTLLRHISKKIIIDCTLKLFDFSYNDLARLIVRLTFLVVHKMSRSFTINISSISFSLFINPRLTFQQAALFTNLDSDFENFGFVINDNPFNFGSICNGKLIWVSMRTTFCVPSSALNFRG